MSNMQILLLMLHLTLQIYLSWWGLNCFRPKTFDF